MNAGGDSTVTMPNAATLSGTVTDDGLPTGSTVTSTWTKVSGPGTVTFADPNAASTTATFSAEGSYVLRLTGSDGSLSSIDDVAVAVARAGVIDIPVRVSSDDAEEKPSGTVATSGDDLELTTDGTTVQTVGLRFTGVAVPQGASITKAYIQFQADEVTTATTSLTVAAQAADNPPTFTTATKDVSSRPRTPGVSWTPAGWVTIGDRLAAEQTPSLTSVVQALVSRSGWVSGNAMAFVVTGTGTRTAEAYEGGAAKAAVLHIEFGSGGGTTPPPTNNPPVVDAGPATLSVTMPDSAPLAGSVTDDGQPTPAQLTETWTQVSGTGTATFADPIAASTTATFSAAGTYVLRLTGSDGQAQSSDDVTVTVTAATGNAAPVVNAGPDSTVTLPDAAALSGTVTDDGQPSGATVTSTWSTVSGPGTVTFASATSPSTTATFSAAGSYVLRLRASDPALTAQDDVTVTVNPTSTPPPAGGAVDIPVRASSDDAEEVASGTVTLASGDLNMVTDGTRVQTVGMRFTGVTLPAGATITNAYVQFQVDQVDPANTCNLVIAGQTAANPATFTTAVKDVSARARTTATVAWTPAAWDTLAARTAAQRTPDLSSVLREVVSGAGWTSGNAVVLVVTDTGVRTAESFDGGSAKAPVLHIDYTV